MPKPKNEEPIFVEPKFDKKEFLLYERERAKAIIFVFVIGLLVGLLSGYFQIYGYWYLGVLLLIVILYLLNRIVKLLKIGMPKRTSHKFLMYAELIITWFIFWLIALNPPLHVVSGPEVIDLSYYHAGAWSNITEVNGKYTITQNSSSMRELRYYTNYKYSITNVSIKDNGVAVPYHKAGHYVYFNLTGLSVNNSYTLDIYENSTHVNTFKSYNIYVAS